MLMPPAAARLDVDVALARLKGAALDTVDTAEFAAQAAIQARDRVRGVGERASRKAEDSPIMRAANEAAKHISDHMGKRDDA